MESSRYSKRAKNMRKWSKVSTPLEVYLCVRYNARLNHLRIHRILLHLLALNSSKPNLTQFVDIHKLSDQRPMFFNFKVQADLHLAVYRNQMFRKRQVTVCSFWKKKAPGVSGISASLQSGIRQSYVVIFNICLLAKQENVYTAFSKKDWEFNSQYSDTSLPLRNISHTSNININHKIYYSKRNDWWEVFITTGFSTKY